jgi:hypothetical protein
MLSLGLITRLQQVLGCRYSVPLILIIEERNQPENWLATISLVLQAHTYTDSPIYVGWVRLHQWLLSEVQSLQILTPYLMYLSVVYLINGKQSLIKNPTTVVNLPFL